jgi:branched-chain amino acid aminotransferase
MFATSSWKITRIERSKLQDINLEHLPFGKYFSDHMLEADYVDGAWRNVEIKPYQPLLMEPSMAALHYGQAIFEGIKAYRLKDGKAVIFRPQDNFHRFNISAARMQMPEVPESIFMEGMRQLISLDQSWIPSLHDHSLYIRPFMFSNDHVIGVKPSETYKFMIILSPTGPYYVAPMRIYVEEKYTRAAPGGVGYAKAAGNYGAAMLATAEARKKGYDQVLWTDAFEHRYVQEIGTMNVFFVMEDEVLTPDLSSGTILAGVTRDSAITMLRDAGHQVVERPVSIDELAEAYDRGQLKEVFGTGTAATISLIRELRYKEKVMHFDPEKAPVSRKLKEDLAAVKEGLLPDNHGWLFPI